jgi:hypothetical protein
MSYCSVQDVAALNVARTLGQGNNPTTAQVQIYINMVAGEIDAILTNKGYTVPVSPLYPEAVNFLNGINAKGAWALMEAASPTSTNLDRAEKAYAEALKMLNDAQTIMDVPKDVARAEPRGPGVTTPPGVQQGETFDPVRPWGGHQRRHTSAPLFSRNMEF